MVINRDSALPLIIMINCNLLNKWFGTWLLVVSDLSRDAERFDALSKEVTESPLKLMMAFLTLQNIAGSLSMV